MATEARSRAPAMATGQDDGLGGKFGTKFVLDNMPWEDKNAQYMRFLLIGKTGVGKSAVANVMLGSSPFDDPDGEQLFRVAATADAGTLTVSAAGIHRPYLGNPKWPNIEPVDAPGLDDPRGIEQDEIHIDMICRRCRDLEQINGILLVVGNDIRIDKGTRKLLDCLSRSIPGFEKNLGILVNRWDHSPKANKKRSRGRLVTERHYIQEFTTSVLTRSRDKDQTDSLGKSLAPGCGFTAEEASRIPFIFVNTHSVDDLDNDEEDEAEFQQNLGQWVKLLQIFQKRQPLITLSVTAKKLHQAYALAEQERLKVKEQYKKSAADLEVAEAAKKEAMKNNKTLKAAADKMTQEAEHWKQEAANKPGFWEMLGKGALRGLAIVGTAGATEYAHLIANKINGTNETSVGAAISDKW